jgi:Family of unknown function (DUF6298)
MANSTPIVLHPDNPRYFLYRDKPLVLITATEHYGAVINRNFNYKVYLTDMVDKRQTLSRCFLLFRELQVFDMATHPIPLNPHSPCKPLASEYVSPFLRTGPGFATDGYPKFDLDQWNPEYFKRLHGFLSAAQERSIIIELTLFSNTYHDAIWNLNPFNIRNNINGIGDIAWPNYVSMRDKALFERQLAYVRKVVQEVNGYDNIYFEVCNEPFTAIAHMNAKTNFAMPEEVEAWQRAIRTTVREEEQRLPKRHLIFQVPLEFWRSDLALEDTLSEADIDAINMHDYQQLTYKDIPLTPLSRFMQRDLRLKRIQHFWTTIHETAKPFVFDEDNAATNALDEEAWTVHRKRAWATICSGGHYNMIDFSIQVGGQETGTPASQAMIRTWMKYLSSFIHSVDFVHMTPLAGFASEVPQATIAITLANSAEYVIYLADAREVDNPTLGQPCQGRLGFTLPAGSYTAGLYSPVTGQYGNETLSLAGGEVALELKPFQHDLVVHIQKKV